ncbi:MAG: hypothetical protein CVV64_11095 [Candidatus Wallbacteria bacterium HGW-Wallbacteria-1]|jgi:hypothetical protein|uniref:Fibronectin type-III domain-containing protein n=1 Tax=Candidatus Wallbacteria bacterium HGW-Wallbacteria-1 TaxID=2013854 RepID=A0A2N1PNY6_9BACT|nr:MAG: hypothetical protein CVV64_11095 [Candidatus Wallbacteria bacterium HGW-Wallbacteria-1]
MRKTIILLLLLSVVFVGCLNKNNTSEPILQPAVMTGPFGAAGGAASILLASGAYSAYTAPTMTAIASAPAFTDTVNIKPMGEVYQVNPAGVTLNTAAGASTITFKYNPAALPTAISPDMVRVYKYVNGAWAEQTTVLNVAALTVAATITDFSMYRIAGDIRISKLAVSTVAVTNATTLVLTFTKKLDAASAATLTNYAITVGGVTVTPTGAVYSTAVVDGKEVGLVTFTVPDQSASEGAAVAVTVAPTLKDEFGLAYDPAAQPAAGTTSSVDIVLNAPVALVPVINGDSGNPIVVQAGTGVTSVSWGAVTYSNSSTDVSYELQIADDAAFTTNAKSLYFTAVTTPVLDLEKAAGFNWYAEWNWDTTNTLKTYNYRVRAYYKKGVVGSEVISNWSTASNLRYDRPNNLPTAPASPLVNSVAATADTVAIPTQSISWTASTDQETPTLLTYTVEFHTATFADANTPAGAISKTTGVGAVTYALAGAQAELADNTMYFWRVKAVDPRGGVSEWSAISQFYFNKVNDLVTVANMAPANGQGIPNSASGAFTADVTNSDKDVLSYTVNIYTEAAKTTNVGTYTGTTWPINMTNITWAANHPVEDSQAYYWELLVTETTPTLAPASAVQTFGPSQFVKSDGASAPVVTLNAPATTPNAGETTPFTWTATDSDTAVNTLTYHAAVFSADSDTSIISGLEKEAITALTIAIADIKAAHGLTANTGYWFGVRASDGDAATRAANDPYVGSNYGGWKRVPFTYKTGPAIEKVYIANVGTNGFDVFWKTGEVAINNKVVVGYDGAAPSVTVNEDAAKSTGTIHVARLSWGTAGQYKSAQFYVSSESAAIAGLATVGKDGANFYATPLPDVAGIPSNDSILCTVTGGTAGDVVLIKVSDGSTKKTYYYMEVLGAQGVLTLTAANNYWNNVVAIGGVDRPEAIAGFAATYKIVDVESYGSASKTNAGPIDLSAGVITTLQGTVPLQ